MSHNYESEIRTMLVNIDKRLTRLESGEEMDQIIQRDLVARVGQLEDESVPQVDRWLPRPAGVRGQQIRHRKTFEYEGRPAYRLGGAQFYVIVAETVEWVIWQAWDADGSKSYGEKIHSKAQFEEDFERRPGL